MIAKGTFTKRRIVAAGVAVLAVAGAGAAIAATQGNSPQADSQAVVNDAAGQLGVTPNELSTALKKALSNRVDDAVRAGRITKAEGDALKARINSGEYPLFGGPRRHSGPGRHGFGFRHGPKHDLSDAASYLGLTQAQLRTQLNQGRTLAQIARDRDKSVDGLVDRLVDAKRDRINAAVEDGRLTRAQADEKLEGLRDRITDFVKSGRFEFRFRDSRRGGDFEERFRGGPGPVLPAEPGLGIAPAA